MSTMVRKHGIMDSECDFLAIESKVSVSTVAINVKRPAEVFQEGHGPLLALPSRGQGEDHGLSTGSPQALPQRLPTDA